jgi:cell division control protein 7
MASAVLRRRAEENFRIHEDVPSTEDTQVNDESMADEQEDYDEDDDQQGEADDQQSDDSGSSAEEVVDTNVQIDMEKLQNSFPGFRHKYRLIKRIGEG